MCILPLCLLTLFTLPLLEDPKPSLDEAYRGWVKSFSTRNKLEQERTLKAILPEQRDIDVLFPRYSSRLWPIIDQSRKVLVTKLDDIAKAYLGAGEIRNIKIINIRENEKKREEFAELLKILPKDIILCDVMISYQQSSSRNGTFVYVNGRWIWFQAIETLPELLKRLK